MFHQDQVLSISCLYVVERLEEAKAEERRPTLKYKLSSTYKRNLWTYRPDWYTGSSVKDKPIFFVINFVHAVHVVKVIIFCKT